MIPDARRSASRPRRALLALACLLPALAACRAACPEPAAQPQPAARPAVFAVAEVADAPGPGIREHAFARGTDGEVALLHVPETFRVARSFLTSDDSGYPAVGFELAPEERARFRSWTAQRVGRGIAILVDGDLYVVATLMSALPGSGHIAGGPRPFTREEALALSERLAPGAA